MKTCEHCGQSVEEDDRFCPHCRANLMTRSDGSEETGEVEWQPTEEQLLSTM
jgi:uncharacterized membrane protein YvbJ